MTNEIDSKIIEDDKANTESHASLTALDLLGAAAGAAAHTADAKDIGKDLVGKLELTDKNSSIKDSLSDILGSTERLDRKELPLSRTERLLLSGMEDAVKSGNLDKVQDMLKTLSENPKSVDRVLRELNERMIKENWLNSARWEQGTDSDGNNFVRLHLYHNSNNAGKSSGGTEVTVGSDGRHSATNRDLWNSPATHVDPAESMRLFGGKQNWQFLPHYDNPNYKKTY